jgi:drug/metabolite transporter (DMT)-like permease
MTVVLALGAALCNAFNVVAQHRASTAEASPRGVAAVTRALLRSPLWWVGSVALIGAFVLQALALHAGELSIVQALLVSEVVIALGLRRFWLGQEIQPAAWFAAALTCGGLALFVDAAEPQGGHAAGTAAAWLWSVLTFGSIAGMLTLLGGRGSPRQRAASYGAAAAVVWAIEATFIKEMTETLASRGVAGMLERWPVYAVIVGGVAGTGLVQAALHVGPLAVSQPLMVAVDPLVSVILAMWIFGEHFTKDPTQIALGCVGFVAMATGIVLLPRFSPPILAVVEPAW